MADPAAAAREAARIRSAYRLRGGEDRYSWFNPAQVVLLQEIERRLLIALARRGWRSCSDRRVLEVGCGTGGWLLKFVMWGFAPPTVLGVDLLLHRLREARHRCGPGVGVSSADATALPVRDGSMDLVVQATMMSSVLDPAVRAVAAREFIRVLRPGGLVIWYDLRRDNPSNPNVRGIRRNEIVRLFPGCRVSLEPVTLAPPLARALEPRFPLLARVLRVIPALRTHYLGFFEKPG